MQMWLCIQCLHIHAWNKACTSKSHPSDVIADFLIHGVTKPHIDALSNNMESGSTYTNDASVGLTLDMLDTVFQRRITTIASIPPPCRLQFSRTLKAALDKVLAKPGDLQAWIQLLFLPTCTLNLYAPKCPIDERSGTRKKLQIAAINQNLSVWREPSGCAALVQQLLSLSKQSKANRKPTNKKKRKKISANIVACKKKISYGHYAAAIRVLSSNGLATPIPDTLQDLQLKYPPAPPPSIPTYDTTTPSLEVDVTEVLSAIKSFPKGTSCGRDGLRAHHLLDAISDTVATVSDELLLSVTCVVNLWLGGNCSPSLGEFITSAPLTPLLKPGGGVRPIA
ncbi:uncharacterized protein LOC113358136 [Papaver somniferum]|uniref:uncharacterized protein LOC113358136 n=1 Tax=Papaver somniferum TaxID=3469 RepID=UPI000E700277|nr:uncharacterized protein LOC113358136 [Papaver somniferum]XP_026457447.1 uncharacterized protein LOC113358136 [Papaver somniferum]